MTRSPLSLLREAVDLPKDGPEPPPGEALRLLHVASRLRTEDRWSRLEVLRDEPLGLWALRGEHFSESFDSCETRVVVPLGAHDPLSVERHEAILKGLDLDQKAGIFYALLDGGGAAAAAAVGTAADAAEAAPGAVVFSEDPSIEEEPSAATAAAEPHSLAAGVVLYELRPAPLQLPPDKRPLSEPAYVPNAVLATFAEQVAKAAEVSGRGRGAAGRGSKKRRTKQSGGQQEEEVAQE